MDNTLRANRILLNIGQATLTEAEKLTLTTIDDLEAVFKSLGTILDSRVDSAGAIKKLNAYAFSQGIQLEVKKTFEISWDDCSIDGELLDEFIGLSQSADDVTFIKTNYDLTTTTTTCRLTLSESFARDYERGKYSYNGVKIKLEEV